MKTEANQTINPTGDHSSIQPEFGLTKREYFAAMAMQGCIARGEKISIEDGLFVKEVQFSVAAADALINELNK